MQQTVEAIFEQGSFRPLDASDLHLAEGQKVRLVIEASAQTANDLLELAAQVYEGLAPSQIDEIEKIALERRDFFGAQSQ